MKKLLMFILILAVILSAGFMIQSKAAGNNMPFLFGLKEKARDCYAKFKHEGFALQKEIMDKIYDANLQQSLKNLGDMEEQYTDKLLQAYHINITDFKNQLAQHHFDLKFRKEYIMGHAKITEQVYNEKFIAPLSAIKRPSIDENMTLKQIRELYSKYVSDKIDYLKGLLGS